MKLKPKLKRLAVLLTVCAVTASSINVGALGEINWTGKEWSVSKQEIKQMDSFRIGREDARSPFYPFTDEAKALASQQAGRDRDLTGAYYQSLNTAAGQTWKFFYVPAPSLRDKRPDNANIMNPDYDDSAWDEITVPKSWEASYNEDKTFKYNPPAYTNVTYVWSQQNPNPAAPNAPTQYNPVGFYRTKLNVDEAHKGRNIFLNFDGVESSFYVWVNGQKVGYSTDSFTSKEFKIDEYLKFDGTDTLAVEVFKWSSGSWFEDQDMISLSGIFRSVYLTSKADVEMRDFTIVPKKTAENNYTDFDLDVYTSIRRFGNADVNGFSLSAALYTADGEKVPDAMLENAQLSKAVTGADLNATDTLGRTMGTVKLSARVKNPLKWSAEKPNLYKLLLTLKDAGGNIVETTAYRFGFRVIEIKNQGQPNAQMTINGQPLLLKGVNIHENSASGRALSSELIRKDVTMMKQNNFNAVRMAHYPHDWRYYDAADEIGLYVMDEANVETHGARNIFENDATYRSAMIDRLSSMFYRSKNAPCVTIHSLGNEAGAGENFGEMVKWLKGTYAGTPSLYVDETLKGDLQLRPIHYEGDNNKADIQANMYTRMEDVVGASNVNKPYILMEFSHAMGNSNGYYKEYWDQFEKKDNIQGGFIWDWTDQGILTYQAPGTFIPQNKLAENWGKDDTQYVTLSQNENKIPVTLSDKNAMDAAGVSGKALCGYAVAQKTPEALNLNRDLTLEAYVYPETAGQGIHVIMAKGDNQYQIKTVDNRIQFNVYNGTWDSIETTFNTGDWAGKWHHIAAVYNASTKRGEVYIDDMSKPAASGVCKNVSADGSFSQSSKDFSIGRDVDHTDRDWSGAIDSVRVYNTALTAEELSDADRTAADNGVVYWQDFDGEIQNGFTEIVEEGYYGYGGDWGDSPNDSNFCANGIVSTDRTPHGSMLELKRVHQDYVMALKSAATTSAEIEIRSRALFTDSSDYDFVWALKRNGEAVRSGTQTVSVAPLETKNITLNFDEIKPEKDSEYLLTAKFVLKEDKLWADKGHEISAEQFAVDYNGGKSAVNDLNKLADITYTETDDSCTVNGSDFTLGFDKTTGTIKSFVYKNKELFAQDAVNGPAPNYWRAITDNDRESFGSSPAQKNSLTAWRDAGAKRHDITTTVTPLSSKAVKISVHGKLAPSTGSATYKMIFIVYANGRVEIENDLKTTGFTSKNIMPAVGNIMQLSGELETMTWYGRGSDTEGLRSESYQDRKSKQFVDVFSEAVSDQYTAYSKVQTSGNKTDVRWAAFTDENGTGIAALGDENLFQINAQHYTPEELTSLGSKHPYEANKTENVVVTLDHKQMGVGYDPGWLGKSWWKTDDMVYPRKNYNYSYTLIPVDNFAPANAFAARSEAYDLDEQLVEAAKQTIGNSVEIPYNIYGGMVQQAQEADILLNAKLDSGVTAKTAYVTDHFEVTLTKGNKSAVVSPFAVTIAPKPVLSSDAAIKTIIINGFILSGVSGDVNNYTYNLSAGEKVTAEDIQAVARDSFASVSVAVENGKAIIKITSEDGKKTNVYTVTLVKPAVLSGNNNIASLAVKGKILTAKTVNGAAVYSYTLKSKEKIDASDITVKLADGKAVKSMTRSAVGTKQRYVITVTAQNGDIKTAQVNLVPPKKGWLYTLKGAHYYMSGGKAKKGFAKVGGKLYYFGKKGVQKTGSKIFKVGKKTYMVKKGVVVTNKWIKAKKGKYFYAGKNGAFYRSAKKKIKGKIYRFDKKCMTKR